MMTMVAGTKLGHYEIRSKIGEGGMGEVYLAEDTRLRRKVALKILPAELVSNQDRMRRFEQEAQAAAALNHPNIAHIYEIAEDDGRHFFSMEFIDGETLREKIHKEHAELVRLLRYLQHAAEGLSKAHTAGIVHRDLKPDNIMVTRDGHAKILDFGLAKLIEPQQISGSGSSEVATAILKQHSTPGAILGTIGYMSPEQAQGKTNEIDHRSDIFSFGCILYEAVTGHKAFAGKDVVESLNKINREPVTPIAEINPAAPAELHRIIRRCLQKDPERRYQSIKDVAIELEDLLQQLRSETELARTKTSSTEAISDSRIQSSASPASQSMKVAAVDTQQPTSSAEYVISEIKRHKKGVLIVAAIGFVVSAGLSFGIYKLIGPKKTAISFQSAKFTRLTSTGKATAAAISPDGKWVVHVIDDGGRQSLWLRQVAIANSNAQVVPPAEVQYLGLAFSPDGNYVYYSAREKNDSSGALYQIPVIGGTARKLLAGIESSVAFAPDGKQMAFFYSYEDEDRLMIANVDGTGERQLGMQHGNESFIKENKFRGLSWSPDGRTLASMVSNSSENYMSIVAVSAENGEVKFFTPQKWFQVNEVAWLADGNSVLVTAQEQRRSPFKIWQISYPGGEAQISLNDLNSYPVIGLTADSSVLATVQTERFANIWTMPVNDNAHATRITQGRDFDIQPSWTPDGKIVYVSNASGGFDLYLTDAREGNPKQLTANSRFNSGPSVSHDGRYIIFRSDRTGVPHIWRMDSDGGNPKQLTDRNDIAPQISPDGQWVVYASLANKQTIWKVSINGGQPVELSDKKTDSSVFSPDGKQIACYYQEKPNARFKLGILPVEGGQPIKTFALPTTFSFFNADFRWMTDGRAIVYVLTTGGVSNLWAQPVDGSPPKQLTNFTSDFIFSFDFSRDGKQLALSRGTQTSDVVLISNFKQ